MHHTDSESRPALPVIGLIGGIGSGKSTGARTLADEGCLVCDSDALAREALSDPAIVAQIRAWWGDRAFAADAATHADAHAGAPATPDRTRIAHIVFADPAERARLESLVHPWIERRRAALFAHPTAGTVALVIDAPLLLEAGLGPKCDAIVFVDAPLETRQSRVFETRGWTSAELSRREVAQWPLDRKRVSAHHVLRNDGSSDALQAQVRQVLNAVRAAHHR